MNYTLFFFGLFLVLIGQVMSLRGEVETRLNRPARSMGNTMTGNVLILGGVLLVLRVVIKFWIGG